MEKIKVISNSSPIINLSKINKLDLLAELYGEIIIPNAVYEELVLKGSEKYGVDKIKILITKSIIKIQHVKDINLVKSLYKDLDYGEAEVIAMALEIDADLIMLDEVDARKIAEIYGLNKTGFLGILIKAKNNGIILKIKPYLDEIIKQGFWINTKLYDRILKELNEK